MFAVRKGYSRMIRMFLLGVFLIISTICDIKTKKLSLIMLVCFGMVGVVINIFWPEHSLKELVFGVAIGAVLLSVSYMTAGQIGSGDGILFIVTGLFEGGMNNFCLLLWASIFCAVVSGVLLLTKKVNREDRIPFVPFVLITYIGQVIL